ncbi:MAG TPA: tetratricopeptide repeat protein [Longimicrobiales bacterium]|nr:tetratricopeptide repeat protein [Longimicrobiales bacterium]
MSRIRRCFAFSREWWLVMVAVVSLLSFARPLDARQRPTDDVYTRTIALNLAQARSARNEESRNRLYALALEAAREGMERSPGNPRVWLLAGQAHVAVAAISPPEEAASLFATAADAFSRAVAMYPDYEEEVTRERANAWVQAYNAAVTAQNRGEIELAILHFERADTIFQGRPEARFYLGQLYHSTGDLDRSIDAYRGALEILARLEALPAAARTAAGGGMNAVERAEMTAAATFNLAQVLASAGREEEAAEVYRQVLERDPGDLLARMNLATILSRLGHHEEAAEHYSVLLNRNDLYATDLFTIGVGLFQAGDTEAAYRAFGMARELNPYMRDALINELSIGYQYATERMALLAAESDGGARDETASELAALLRDLVDVAAQLTAIDPLNRTTRGLEQRIHLGLAQFETDPARVDSLESVARQIEREVNGWQYHVTDLRSASSGRAIEVQGRVENLSGEAGQAVSLRFTFYGINGLELGTRDVAVTLPAAPDAAGFTVEHQANLEIAGFGYSPVE